jgi:predicted nucleic acid-binding protein
VTRFVLDSSVTMSWCFEDELDPYAERVLDSLNDREALVPEHWKLEVANAMLTGTREGRLDEAQAERFLDRLLKLPITISDSPISVEAAFSVGREYKLVSYDAAYLHLARREGIPLATNDRPLRRAARQARVPLFSA